MAKQDTVTQTKKQPAKPVRRPFQRRPSTGGLRNYYKETMGELHKVTWPTRKEAVSLTWIVIIVMFSMAVVLGGLDVLFYQFFQMIFKL